MFAALRSRASRAIGLASALPRLQAPVLALSPLVQQNRGLICLRTRLGRGRSHRWAMMKNLVQSLIEHERIKTTQARAWELKRVADRVVTFGKKGTKDARVQAGKYVRTRPELVKLFTILADRFRDRQGGYTRMLKTYPRMGDAAPMAFIEFVDRPVHRMRMPPPLQEQPQSAYPGRGGRKYRAHKRDLRNEIHPTATPRNIKPKVNVGLGQF